ncbi:MAG: protein kinase [Kofleriaceae bacterium]|nr:protein kinase [Kofleriaceae bacterium]
MTVFAGTERFEVLDALGRGAHGVVYRVRDRRTGELKALKTLPELSPGAVARLKAEFRAVAGVVHPHLVTLYELETDAAQAFFTMALVEGVDAVSWVRAVDGEARWERARSTVAQLALALEALHARGAVHRDVKPSNVLVRSDGTLALLDFGIAVRTAATLDAAPRGLVGSPAYMAPEQAQGRPATAACDWYGAGALLFEALTGTLPFTGTPREILVAKRQREAPAPREYDPDIPAALDGLCRALLTRAPELRAGGSVVAAAVGTSFAPHARRTDGALLIGRAAELARLDAAAQAARTGSSAVVRVRGVSGIGKSTLVAAALASFGPALVLDGRCHLMESVPYKALDGVIDALARALVALDADRVASLLPPHVAELARMFPTLRQRAEIAAAPLDPVVDVQERRRRAVLALSALLERLAADRLVVVAIDDLQWGDLDSAWLLLELLRTAPRGVLTVLAYRAEDIDASPFLRQFVPGSDALETVAVTDVALQPLARADAEALLAALLPDDAVRAASLAAEAGGSPLLLHALARHAPTTVLPLGDVIRSRVAQLPVEARQLLEVLALAGRPLAEAVAHDAAGSGSAASQTLARLRAESLIRERVTDGRDAELETFHDRIRETITAELADDHARTVHGAIARALVARGATDPERLLAHFAAAGAHGDVARYGLAAADRAFDALAFDQAARLYAQVLASGAAHDAHRVRARRGEALANAGRGVEAADAYLEAANAITADAADARAELERLAAEQYLRAGHIDEGMRVVSGLLAALGLPRPATPRRALVHLLAIRARLRLRELLPTRSLTSRQSPEDRQRIDTCWSLGLGLGSVDSVRGAVFQGRGLLLALDAGDPWRLARALCLEAAYLCNRGAPTAARSAALLERAKAISAQIDDPRVKPYLACIHGLRAFHLGDWAGACSLLGSAENMFRAGCSGVRKELVTAIGFRVAALVMRGAVGELATVQPAMLAEAVALGDRYGVANLTTGFANTTWLIRDDPEEAQRRTEACVSPWREPDLVPIQFMFDLIARTQIALYTGDGGGAWRLFEREWPPIERSMLMRMQFVRIMFWTLRARAALAADVRRLARVAAADAKRIRREARPWATPAAELIAAALAPRRDERIAHLDTAVRGFGVAGMWTSEQAARVAAGLVRGGGDGHDRASAALDAMSAAGIVAPERYIRMYAPGPWS